MELHSAFKNMNFGKKKVYKRNSIKDEKAIKKERAGKDYNSPLKKILGDTHEENKYFMLGNGLCSRVQNMALVPPDVSRE